MQNNEYVKKWRLNDVKDIVDSVDAEFRSRINNAEFGIDYINIVSRAMASSIVCMREILCLCSNGYPNGALARARLLCEHAITLAFIDGLKEKGADKFTYIVRNYHINYEVQRLQTLLGIAKIFNNNDEIKECRKQLEDLEDNYHDISEYKKANDYLFLKDYWWTEIFDNKIGSFNQIMIRTSKMYNDTPGLRTQFKKLLADYKLACFTNHSSLLGNIWMLGKNKNINFVDTNATLQGHNIPLRLALRSFLFTCLITSSSLSLDLQSIDQMNELLIFYEQFHGDLDNTAK